MPSLHPVAVIAQHLFNEPPAPQYRRPVVTTRRPAGAAEVTPVAAPAVAPARVTWRSRIAHLVVHPVSTVRQQGPGYAGR